MKVRDSLHASLSFEGQTDEQRRIIATKILDISNEISDGYDRHNHYLKHGVMPAAITKEVKSKAISLDALDKNQLLLRKIKITSHISHYKAYLKDPIKNINRLIILSVLPIGRMNL